jgi:hypothetical protein
MASDKNPPQRTADTTGSVRIPSGNRVIPYQEAPLKFEPDTTPWGEIIEHALQVIRDDAPVEFQAKREALHKALLEPRYYDFPRGFGPMGEEVDPALKPVVRAALKRGREAVKDTFEQLKQAVEARIRTDQELKWSKRAKDTTWRDSQSRKLPGKRLGAKQRLEEGGDPNAEHRVTGDLPLDDIWFIPGTVKDGWLANGTPKNRQGPRVKYEDARQGLFELTTGTLGLPLSSESENSASSAVKVLLLIYVGEQTGNAESLRLWWLKRRR